MVFSLLFLVLMFVILTILSLIAAGLAIGFIAMTRAPFGYEDETGFHFGQQEGTAVKELPGVVPVPKPI